MKIKVAAAKSKSSPPKKNYCGNVISFFVDFALVVNVVSEKGENVFASYRSICKVQCVTTKKIKPSLPPPTTTVVTTMGRCHKQILA